MNSLDYLIVGFYAVALIAIATYVSRTKKGEDKTPEEYFLAGRSLPWWAIGTSLIAANIAADQIIGMNGDAYAFGMAIAVYEWTAAVALIVVGKFLLPVYLKQQVFTMPQLLSQRYDTRVSKLLAVLMLIMYIFCDFAHYFVAWCESSKQSYRSKFNYGYGIAGFIISCLLIVWWIKSCRLY